MTLPLIICVNIPARPDADPRSGITVTSGYRPERLAARLREAFEKASGGPAPEPVAAVVLLDGVERQGLQMVSEGLRVFATGLDSNFLIVSVADWDGPLELKTIMPRSSP
jgi:hypothetical protein